MQRARVSNHPCHRLSVPAAKRFWCRHCMMVFEDAITRWRHSRSCRSGGFDNFVRRREIETQALQKMAETLDPEMVTPVAVPSEEGGAGCSKELCCFICRQRFVSLDEMREHVKYPCNKPASLQRPSMTVYIEEPTFGTGIQQHYTDGPASQYQQGSSIPTASAVSAAASSPHPVTVYMNDSEQSHQHSEAKPTNIYVNEKGETVIEVENLDLSTKSGELSLAHLLTQLSQQGIVFDQQPQGETEDITSHHEPQIVQDTTQEIDYSQPTAVDAANTLTQLAGSAFRATSNPQETYTYLPSKRIKTEGVELQYQLEQQEHMQGQTYFQKDEPADQPEQEKYIICTNDSEVISVVRADDISSENSNNGAVYQNGPVSEANDQSGSNHIQATLGEANSEQTVIFQGQPDQDSHTVVLHSTENGTAETSFASTPMIVLEDQPQVHAVPTGQLIKCEDQSDQLVITTHSASGVEQTGELAAVQSYPSEQSTAAVIRTVNISQEREEAKSVLITSASSQEATTTLTSDKAATGLLHSSGEPAIVRISDAAQVDTPAESALLLPPIVPMTSPTSDSNQVILQHEQNTGMVALPSVGNPIVCKHCIVNTINSCPGASVQGGISVC